jgi:hypothetical protein
VTSPPTTHLVTTDVATYQVVDDITTTFGALIIGRAVDELTGQPPYDPIECTATLDGITPGAPGEERRFSVSHGDGGTFALAGEVDRTFPNHAVAAYQVDLAVRAFGYLPAPGTVSVPAAALFPLPPVQVPLHRRALWLEGRTVDGGGAPVANTVVSVVQPAGLAGLQASLSFAHGSLTPIDAMAPAAVGAPLQLWRDAFAGESDIWLWTRTNLAVGALVRLTSTSGTEFAMVAALPGAANLAKPGRVVLQAPLSFQHTRSSASVQVLNPGIPTGSTTLNSPVYPGDEVFFVASTAVFTSGVVIRVSDPAPSLVEWRIVLLPVATSTNPGGFYRLGPVGRALALRVHALPPVPPNPPDVTHLVDYGQQDNVLNLTVA